MKNIHLPGVHCAQDFKNNQPCAGNAVLIMFYLQSFLICIFLGASYGPNILIGSYTLKNKKDNNNKKGKN